MVRDRVLNEGGAHTGAHQNGYGGDAFLAAIRPRAPLCWASPAPRFDVVPNHELPTAA